ncbi:hypothetical protein DZF91_20690 [Actinomadura logoneensis]|uniref:CU044_5270 family protein n=1 Tax=Actinomadura logoneensis TaxID=2293572 RepID=A0A372JI95_9ACTN|nr:CU044_5270 family protein [Actinomadura logoneensis]RFU39737.1 hypothetical protein DZF91_20690 [Actinomadura logoneensis]
MDELEALTALAANPAPQTVASGRARLEAEARRAAGAPARLSGRRRFLPPRATLFTGFGLTLAGAAAVAVLTSGTATPRAPGGPGAPGGTDGSFLEVAAKADLLPSGRYWYSDEIQGQSYMQRPKSGPYAIIGAHSETYQYVGAQRKDGSGFWGRDLPSRPASAGDAAAWRRAGSPSSFRVWSNDHHWTYTTKATAWEDDPAGRGMGGRFPGLGPDRKSATTGKKSMTVEGFAALPTDPAALAELLFPKMTGFDALDPLGANRMPKEEMLRLKQNPGSIPPRDMTPREKISAGGTALKDMPLPPKVRSGLMRALAAQPGVHTVKNVRDPLGREGVALVADPVTRTVTGEYGTPKVEQGTYSEQEELVFDPKTGALLSQQNVLARPGGPYAARKPGAVLSYWIVRSGGWTDAEPTPPAKLPF